MLQDVSVLYSLYVFVMKPSELRAMDLENIIALVRASPPLERAKTLFRGLKNQHFAGHMLGPYVDEKKVHWNMSTTPVLEVATNFMVTDCCLVQIEARPGIRCFSVTDSDVKGAFIANWTLLCKHAASEARHGVAVDSVAGLDHLLKMIEDDQEVIVCDATMTHVRSGAHGKLQVETFAATYARLSYEKAIEFLGKIDHVRFTHIATGKSEAARSKGKKIGNARLSGA